MSRPPRSEATRLQLALAARRAVEEELAATPTLSYKEVHARVAIRLKITTRTLRKRLAEASAMATPKDLDAVVAELMDRQRLTFEKLVTAHQGDVAAAKKHVDEQYRRATENLFDWMRWRRINRIRPIGIR